MDEIGTSYSHFYLSRKLILVVGAFVVLSSSLVVLTNYAVNMIAASQDYTALQAKWSQYHYKARIAIEQYGKTGDLADYKAYKKFYDKQEKAREPIVGLFDSRSNPEIVFNSLNQQHVTPSEISSLLLTFDWFKNWNSIKNIHQNWLQLVRIDQKQNALLKSIQKERVRSENTYERSNDIWSTIHALNQKWEYQNNQLMRRVGRASLDIKRLGLWASVILGILLLLIGLVISVRAKKSINRWEQSLHEKDILLAEIHHRVKNNLAVISGLLELESMGDGNPMQALKESRDRIHSMAMIHEILYQSQSFSEIRLDQYIQKLSDYVCKTYVSTDKKIDLNTHLDPVTLNINQAVPAGLILNELIANVIEHGFKKKTKGLIKIKLEEVEGKVCLTLWDDGEGFSSEFDLENTQSTGLTIVKTLVKQLDANFDMHHSNGTTVTLMFDKSAESGSSNMFF